MVERNVAVIPAYNEEDHIRDVITSIESTDIIDDIIVVDDASTDDTVHEINQTDAFLIQNEHNMDYGGAIIRGYDKAVDFDANLIFRLDADGQHNSDDLHRFYDALREDDCQYVIGNRFADPAYRQNMPLDRLFGNKVVSLMTSIRLRQWIHDPPCGYRAMDASFVEGIPYEDFSHDFRLQIEELFAFKHLGASIAEIPVDCIYGDEESTLTYYDGLMFLQPVFVWWNSFKEYDTSHATFR